MDTALLVIDMQNGYFEDPALESQREGLVERCNDLMARARRAGAPVYAVATEHDRDGSTWTVTMRDDGQGYMFSNTDQVRFLPGLQTDGAHRVVKIRDSAFHGTELAQRLRIHGVSRLLLAGVSAQDCIARTGADGFAHDFRVGYALQAIGSTDAEQGQAALQLLHEQHRQPLLDADGVREWLR